MLTRTRGLEHSRGGGCAYAAYLKPGGKSLGQPNLKFTKAYEVYSSKFQKEDFGEEDRFDPNVLPQGYLTDPQHGHAFVYVATIQRLAVNILGRQAIFGTGGPIGWSASRRRAQRARASRQKVRRRAIASSTVRASNDVATASSA